MEVTYQKELFYKLMPELTGLFIEHYEEVALDKEHMQLNPAWQQFVQLELTGILHVLTARAEGKLVGYHFNLVYPHLHYADVLCSHSDMFFMSKPYRNWFRARQFFKANEEMLKSLGVKKTFVMTKIHIPVINILERMGYKRIEYIASKWLGG